MIYLLKLQAYDITYNNLKIKKYIHIKQFIQMNI